MSIIYLFILFINSIHNIFSKDHYYIQLYIVDNKPEKKLKNQLEEDDTETWKFSRR